MEFLRNMEFAKKIENDLQQRFKVQGEGLNKLNKDRMLEP